MDQNQRKYKSLNQNEDRYEQNLINNLEIWKKKNKVILPSLSQKDFVLPLKSISRNASPQKNKNTIHESIKQLEQYNQKQIKFFEETIYQLNVKQSFKQRNITSIINENTIIIEKLAQTQTHMHDIILQQAKLLVQREQKQLEKLLPKKNQKSKQQSQEKIYLNEEQQKKQLIFKHIFDLGIIESSNLIIDNISSPKINKRKGTHRLTIDVLQERNEINSKEYVDLQLTFQSNEQYVDELNNQKQQNLDMIVKLENEIKSIKSQLKQLNQSQKDFLSSILKEGQDTRLKGICWVIQEMHLKGYLVKTDDLPIFLDQQSKEFLLKKAQYENQKEDLEYWIRYSTEIFKSLKNMDIQDDPDVDESEQQKQDLLEKVKQFIFKNADLERQMFSNKITYNEIMYSKMHQILNSDLDDKNQNNSLEIGIDLSKINNAIENIFIIYEDDHVINSYKTSDDLILEFKRISKIHQQICEQLNTIQTNELKRVLKQFQHQNYEIIYNISFNQVLRCLKGNQKSNLDHVNIKN